MNILNIYLLSLFHTLQLPLSSLQETTHTSTLLFLSPNPLQSLISLLTGIPKSTHPTPHRLKFTHPSHISCSPLISPPLYRTPLQSTPPYFSHKSLQSYVAFFYRKSPKSSQALSNPHFSLATFRNPLLISLLPSIPPPSNSSPPPIPLPLQSLSSSSKPSPPIIHLPLQSLTPPIPLLLQFLFTLFHRKRLKCMPFRLCLRFCSFAVFRNSTPLPELMFRDSRKRSRNGGYII